MKFYLTAISLLFATIFSNLSANAQSNEELAKAFGQIPNFSRIVLSPDGDKIATLMNYNGQRILVTKSLTDPSIKPFGIPFNEGEFRWVEWTSNDRIIAGVRFSTEVKRNTSLRRASRRSDLNFMSSRLVAMNWDGSEQQVLYKRNNKRRFQPQFQDTIIDMLPDDPDHVLQLIDIDKIGERSVYKLNVHDASRKLVQDNIKDVKSWETDHNHIVRYAYGFDDTEGSSDAHTFAMYRKSENDEWFSLYDYDHRIEEPPFEFKGFHKNPDLIYVSQIAINGYKGIYILNVDSREVVETIVEPEGNDITDIIMTNSGEYAGYIHKDEYYKRENIDKVGSKLNRTFEQNFPGLGYSISSESRDGTKKIVKTYGPTDPGSYYFVDLDANKVELLDYNYKMVDPTTLSESNAVSFKASDGMDVYGYLTLPSNAENKENLPTVIIPSIRQGFHYSKGFDYWAQFLASQGYAVFQINYRGSSGYGQFYRNLGRGEMGRRIVQDVNEGTKWMIDQGYSDANRICLMGDTFGGYVALQAPNVEQSLYQCSITHGAVTSLSRHLRRMKDFFGYNNIKTTITNDEWDIDEASPIQNIGDHTVPALLFHGEEDMSIDVRHSRDYKSRMEKAKKEVHYFEFDEGDAYLSREDHRVLLLKETGAFLKKHIGG